MDFKSRSHQSFRHLPEYTSLSGAGRKRFWRLVGGKMPPEQAVRIASNGQLPERMTPYKRNLSAHSQSGIPNKIKKKNQNNGPKPNMASKPDNSLELQDKPKVKIISQVEIYNIQNMSAEEMNLVHEALLIEIAKCEIGKGPRFCGFVPKQGWILVTCEDYYTQNWIVKTIEKIKPWPEADLSIQVRNKRVTALTFLPSSEADTIEKALQLLQIQNKWLYTGEWKLLGEKEFDGGRVVTISIDKYSMEALKLNKFKAILGFKTIYVKIMTDLQPPEIAEPNKVTANLANNGELVGSKKNSEPGQSETMECEADQPDQKEGAEQSPEQKEGAVQSPEQDEENQQYAEEL